MKRRTFFKVLSLGIGGLLLGLFVFDFRRVVKMILQKDTALLSFTDPDIIEKFLADADQEQFWKQFSTAKRMFICFQHFFHLAGIPIPYHAKYLQYRSTITGHFLFSTDLFSNGTDVKRPLIYQGFFNPYKAPCANPFSNLRMPV
jgi:hypothetical protein